MYQEILNQLKNQCSSKQMNEFQTKTIHLGIFSDPYLTKMLEGSKTIESRFSQKKILPFQEINKDDIVIVKKSSGDVVAYFTIKDVLFFDLNKTPIDKIKQKYSKELCVDETFWISKQNSKYATLIFIDKIKCLKPFSIHKKGMQTWIKFKKEI